MSHHILLLGAPGAGKGTQSAKIAEEYGVEHVTTGDALRANKDMDIGHMDTEYDTPRAYMEAGELVPDDVVRKLAENAIADQGFDDFVLDGYPRTTQQAEWLTAFLDENDVPLDAVVSLTVPDDVIVQRLSRRRVHAETGETYHLDHDPPPDDVDPDLIVQREDDQPDTIRNRLSVYREETEPLENYFESRDLLVTVDGTGDIREVYDRITTVLDDRVAASPK